jgi:uridine phosphorylase
MHKGITATAGGFTDHKDVLRLNIQDEELNSKMDNFKFGDNKSQMKWKRLQFMDFRHF